MPAHLLCESDEAEADRFLIKKDISFSGLSRPSRVAESFRGYGESDRATKKRLAAMVADGDLIEVQVEGWKAVHYALGSDAAVLHDVSAGRVPKAWAPLETTTTEEVVFLAPLDHVCARGRAKVLFGFDYVWEVYKPEHQRRFGYYTLPMLWGDRLVARQGGVSRSMLGFTPGFFAQFDCTPLSSIIWRGVKSLASRMMEGCK